MPGRPPKRWMRECMAAVRQHGGAKDAGAVCASVWNRKSAGEKRAIVELEEGSMSAKKKKKKKAKKKAPKRSKAKKPKKGKKHHRCTGCGHAHKGPCLHMKGGNLCPCPRPKH